MRLPVALFIVVMVLPRSEGFAQEALTDLPEIVIDTSPHADSQFQKFDRARDEAVMLKLGATSYGFSQSDIAALPQGADTPLDKVLLQAPGVSSDSALSYPDFHVRNEYANTQYRINGIQIPDGITGLGSIVDTGIIAQMNLLTGALPAQYGLRTAGIIDMTTKTNGEPAGDISLYGGSHGTISTTANYGGTIDKTQYFFSTRFLATNLGLESATPTAEPFHDHSNQGKFFGYVSTLLGDSSRLSVITGTAVSSFQIPNVPGRTPLGDFGGPGAESLSLNENQHESFSFGIAALQLSSGNVDSQVALFARYTSIHFVPDPAGDLAFNDVASNVSHQSVLEGVQSDNAVHLGDAHILRGGFGVSAEQTRAANDVLLLPLDSMGTPLPAAVSIADHNTAHGWNIGGYIQDEWKISSQLTLNTGLRFDQLYQFVTANQVSPRAALVYKPATDTAFHIGYARYFTPPNQIQATPVNTALFANTTQQPAVTGDDPVRPERSHYFDAGLDHDITPNLQAGGDIYYKLATNLLDDGQFGQAPLLTQFNAAKGYSEGVELKVKYQKDGFRAYGNLSVNQTKSKDINSNQFLFDDPSELAYIASHYHFTDDAQLVTASAGMSYFVNQTLFSIDGIYGSGLRSGFANLDHVQPYATFNASLSHEFKNGLLDKPLTIRFDIVNLLDTLYILRDGTGIGEFAPQYGTRRGFFLSLSQKV